MDVLHAESLKKRIVIRVEDLTGIVNNKTLWNPTSFNIRGGEKLAIIGDNGVGKSTLINKIVHLTLMFHSHHQLKSVISVKIWIY